MSLDRNSYADTAQIINADDAAVHATCIERNTAAAEHKAKKAHMATISRVRNLRDFFGIASPGFSTLEDDEKEEYKSWRAYARQEREMRQRYEGIAQEPADVEVMIRGWRVDHAPPRLSEAVLALVTEESAVQRSGAYRNGDSQLPPLSEDIIWNSTVLIPTPPSSVSCQICGQCPTTTFLALRAMYRLPCRHYLHVKCFEEDYERWLGRSCTSAAEGGARECIRCKGLKELTRVLPRVELNARIRRVGDKLLDWRRNEPSGTAYANKDPTELGDRSEQRDLGTQAASMVVIGD